jgi:hypothetical protein
VVGVGLEFGFAPNWTAGMEYDYLFRTNEGNTYLIPALAPAITSIAASTRVGRQHDHWAHQLQIWWLRRPDRSQVLIESAFLGKKPRHCPGLFCRRVSNG